MEILVIRLSSLGDIALLSPALEAIKKAYPESRISCLVKSPYKELLSGNPHVDEVLIYQGFWETKRDLKARNFDVLLDLHGVLRTRLLSLFTPAKIKHIYSKNVWRRYRMLFSKGAVMAHVTESYLSALKVLGIGIERVVVFQTAFLGDAVLTLPLLSQIRERLNPQKLCVLSRPEHASLFEREGYEVVIDDKRGGDSGLTGFWRVTRRIRDLKFDMAIVPHRSLRSALLAWLAGIPVRIGFDSSAGRWFFTRTIGFKWEEHDSERNLKLLEALPRRAASGSPRPSFEIPVSESDRGLARTIWKRFDVDPQNEFLIGMAPGSKWETKRWPWERFSALAQELKIKYPQARIVLLGSKEDSALCRKISEAFFCHREGASPWRSHGEIIPVVDLSGKIGLRELVAVMGDLKLFISNDSGPMHIACGLGVPTVAIFGPTVKGFGFYPQSPNSRVVEVEDLACRPCSLHGGRACPRGHFLCMRLIVGSDLNI